MGKYLNRLYQSVMNIGLIPYIQEKNLDVCWVIEAGCHDGTDTLKLLADSRFKKVYAFEPDPIAFELASFNLAAAPERVVLKSVALMDVSKSLKATPYDGVFGTGSTIFSQVSIMEDEQTASYFQAVRLDDEVSNLTGSGALWLDVEGTAHLVLKGALTTLTKIEVAQIEIDMHTQSKLRLKNYREVLRIMISAGFSLIQAPIHPGYFGDALFVKTASLDSSQRIRSKFLLLAMITLHSVVYPILRKPK